MESNEKIRGGSGFRIYLPVFFTLVLIAGVFLGTLLAPVTRDGGFFSLPFGKYDKMNDVINYVEKVYVDSVDRDGLIDKAISGLLHSLDPHSEYISAEDFNEANDPLVGNFDGIGVQFRVIRDTITVIQTVKGGPSEGEGVEDGDRIVKIENQNVAGVKISDADVMKKLKGPRGTKVNISVYRKGEKKLLGFTITRAPIPTYSVDISYIAAPATGYIKLSKFSGTTAEEVHEAILQLKASGMKKLIFDLRGNGGGYMDAAVAVADEFLPDGKLIVYTEGRERPRKNFTATSEGAFETGELIVLIDEWSASASEIVAGAIQDQDRGVIIGRRSFGKGLVQEQTQLPDGSALRVTVARYYTPSGRSIQRPYTGNYEAYYEEFYNRLLEGDSELADSMNMADTIRYKTSAGRIVYGGGGIMPDVYISSAAGDFSPYYKKLLVKGIFYQFAFDYADQNRSTLKRTGSAGGFVKNFVVSGELLKKFTEYAARNGVPAEKDGMGKSAAAISAQIKANIGRNIFDDGAYFPVVQPYDPYMKKALEYKVPK